MRIRLSEKELEKFMEKGLPERIAKIVSSKEEKKKLERILFGEFKIEMEEMEEEMDLKVELMPPLESKITEVLDDDRKD